ncbi:GrpB family protein [Bacillus sp. FJAT-49705]|uniref:GrpB family protein n=1 Tax=Cytobacillus citreus TaxID=2833586 RepID=A0ABS5NW62_9BACI|nr:GrpB family protein [Cytobacillus citreus]MBS4191956.1 GrpB family protein [Cytobacillus citreus]
MRKVEVCPYNEQWVSMFEEEASKLSDIFGEEIVVIEHIGSTSVPGLKAKPIIDIMPVVKDINMVDKYNKAMQDMGYEPKGENGIPNRRYFQKGGDNRTHHVHIYQFGNDGIQRHLAFRDYLIAYPEAKKKYGELKQQLSQQFPYDIQSYILGKENLVKEIERLAIDWYKENQK